MTRTLINNNGYVGSTDGYEKKLEINVLDTELQKAETN
jgi:hypothetical protein